MTRKAITSFIVIALLLVGCGYPIATLPAVVTQNPTVPSPTSNAPTSYPAPVVETPPPPSSAYPEPGSPGSGTPTIPPSGFEPQPGDENLKRDQVFMDLANSKLITTASASRFSAILVGNLSDPCHKLRVVVKPPAASKTINLEVYSLVDTSTACITVLKPFVATIPLGSYNSGQYTVMVNGEKLGGFVAGFGPQPWDDKLTRGEVSLDLAASKLFTSDTQPRLVSAILHGDLSDPCHELRIAVTAAKSQNEIDLEVYSVFDPQTNCTTVIQSFEVTYPLGSFSNGHYSVYVNGQLLGEFDG